MGGTIITACDEREALLLLRQNPGAKILAGGTDIFVELYNSRGAHPCLVDVSPVREWAICREDTAHWEIGALCTFAQLAAFCTHPALACLWQAALRVGSPQIRGRGTVGGNLQTASPAGDISVALLALGASVRLCHADATRTLPLREFFVGPRKTALLPGEAIACVTIPKKWQNSCYLKLGQRKALAISVVSLAAATDGKQFSVALGSVYKTPLLAEQAMALLSAPPVGMQSLSEAKHALVGEIAPIDDMRASARYRETAAAQLLEDAIWQLTKTEGPHANR